MAEPSTKICARCGTDVSGRRRVKDEQGRYYCPACAAAVAATAPRKPAGDYVCSQCQGGFTLDEVYDLNGTTICHACYAQMAAQSGQDKRKRSGGLGTFTVVVVGILAIAAIVAVVLFVMRDDAKKWWAALQAPTTNTSAAKSQTTQPSSQPTTHSAQAMKAATQPTTGATTAPANAAVAAPRRAIMVKITSPEQGAAFTVGDDIKMTAEASVAVGKIKRVQFYKGTDWLGESWEAPYTFTWKSTTDATLVLTAYMEDDNGKWVESEPVQITVDPKKAK